MISEDEKERHERETADDEYIARLERDLEAARAELAAVKAERDAEIEFRLDYRKRHGARDNETMMDFMERLADELAAAKVELSREQQISVSTQDQLTAARAELARLREACTLTLQERSAHEWLRKLVADRQTGGSLAYERLLEALDRIQAALATTARGETVAPDQLRAQVARHEAAIRELCRGALTDFDRRENALKRLEGL